MGAFLNSIHITHSSTSDDSTSDSGSELDDTGHEYGGIYHNTEDMWKTTTTSNIAESARRTGTMSSSAETEPGHHRSAGKDANKCPICSQGFAMRKTMLRHLRTVHAPKNLACPSCNKQFIRQDNLNRHVAEQHTSNDNFVHCESCGRRVSKRGLSEHLESKVCKASRAKVTPAPPSDECGHLYAEDKNDCFLLTMRVLKIWLSLIRETENQSLGNQPSSSETPAHNITSSDAYYKFCSLGNRALDSMRNQMRNETASRKSLKLFCTAVLWACISLAGVHGGVEAPLGFRQWGRHLQGAAALLRVFHSSTCDCDKFLLCPQLQQRASRDPALSLFKAIVRDTGLIRILLQVLPSLVKTWEHAIRLLDVLLQCLLNQIDQCGADFTGRQTLCEANEILSDNDRSRGLEAMIWAMTKIRSEDRP